IEATEGMHVFTIASRSQFEFGKLIEIQLEGNFEWKGEALYIPMKPVRITGNKLPPHELFGSTTPILVPIGPNRTVLALDLEDKPFSKNPDTFIKKMVAGLIDPSGTPHRPPHTP